MLAGTVSGFPGPGPGPEEAYFSGGLSDMDGGGAEGFTDSREADSCGAGAMVIGGAAAAAALGPAKPLGRDESWPPLFLPCHTITYSAQLHPCTGRHDPAAVLLPAGSSSSSNCGVAPAAPLAASFGTVKAAMAGWPPILSIEALPEMVHIVARLGKGKGGDTWLATLRTPGGGSTAPVAGAVPGDPLPHPRPITVVVKRPKAVFPAGARATCALEAGYAYLSPTPCITTAQYAAPRVGNMVRVNPTMNAYREAALGRALTTVALAGATPHLCTVYRVVPTDIPYVLHTFMEPATVTLHAFLSQLRASAAPPTSRPLDLWLRVALLQTFQGMMAAHAALGVRHHDLHVENVLLAQGPPWTLRPAAVMGGGPPAAAPLCFRYELQDEGSAGPPVAVTVPTLGMCWKVIDFQWGSSTRMFGCVPPGSGAGGGGSGSGGGAGAGGLLTPPVGPGGVPLPITDHDVLMNMRQSAHAREHAHKRCTCKHPNRPYAFSQASFDAELLINNAFSVTGTDTPGLADLQRGLLAELSRVHKEAGASPGPATAPVAPDADCNLARKVYRALILYLARPFAGLEAPPGTPVFFTCQPPPINLFHHGADAIIEAAWREHGDDAFGAALRAQGLRMRTAVPVGGSGTTARPTGTPIIVKAPPLPLPRQPVLK